MKKGIVVLLVLLAAVVLVSPAIVGRLAEKSMDENLNWAAAESGDLKVSSEHFTRGWFSSEGQHRVELQEGDLLAALQALAGPLPADDLPVLIINTRLDHGLIPVTSMTRDQGSLAPGLGSAVSTMQVELSDGEIIDLPGTIFSKVALGGRLRSNYVLEAGSRQEDGVAASWGNVDVNVTTDPASGEVLFDGAVSSLSFTSDSETVTLDGLTFEGKQKPTRFDVSVGDIDFALDGLTFGAGGDNGMRISRFAVTGSSTLDGERINASGQTGMTLDELPLGTVSYDMTFKLSGVDAAAMGILQKKISGLNAGPDPTALYADLEPDARRLVAAGFGFDIERLDITLPQGTMTAVVSFSFAESDPATFDWSSLLLTSEASVDLSIPAALIEAFAADSPQAAMAVGGGFLVKRDDTYVLEARFRKGLLTVNGAPMPIPFGAM